MCRFSKEKLLTESAWSADMDLQEEAGKGTKGGRKSATRAGAFSFQELCVLEPGTRNPNPNPEEEERVRVRVTATLVQ